MKKKDVRLVIWSDDLYTDEEARKEQQEFRRECNEDPDYELSDEKWYDDVSDMFDDETCNLNRNVDGVIIAFVDVGRWNGRFQGYRIFGDNIKNILGVREDHNEWWGDGDNIRASLAHHDATHYVLYRVAKDKEQAERIAEQIYNKEIDEAGFRKRTRSLYPYVANIYGWPIKKSFKFKTQWKA